MRKTIRIQGNEYGYEESLSFIISEGNGFISVVFAHIDREKCWKKLFDIAYNTPDLIYLIENEDIEDSLIKAPTDSPDIHFIGEGLYDINTKEPVLLLNWQGYSFKGLTNRLIDIQEAIQLFDPEIMKNIFDKLALMVEIEVNGKVGFGSNTLQIIHEDSIESNYSDSSNPFVYIETDYKFPEYEQN